MSHLGCQARLAGLRAETKGGKTKKVASPQVGALVGLESRDAGVAPQEWCEYSMAS